MKALKLTKRRIIGLVAVILLLILIGYVASPKIPQPPDSVQIVTELDAYLETLVKAGSPPGLSMVIVKNDRIVYSKGFGWADLQNRPLVIQRSEKLKYRSGFFHS